MNALPPVRLATAADRERILDTLVTAFVADPVLRWLFPDDATYPAYAEAFFGHLFDKRIGRRAVWTIDGDSVAVWEPPSEGAQEEADGTWADRFPAEVRARVDAYDHAVHAALPPGPFWYLGVLGTRPEHAGKRWGRAVMAAGLRRAAEDGLPSVLETSNRGNVDLYRRAGWEVVGELTEPVPTWIMRQEPAPRT
ncbi:GNAT family N-acetyltransferase [Mumia sp. DW29H23]|uniref:GNAT family N-acetyltransferase n=1 Tax=Mumia sp. DW29H23 TaxID=3421241 RepID=UPI003D690E19